MDAADERLWEIDDAFLLGDTLLIAPVVEQGALSRKVILPKGNWYDFWDDTRYSGPGEIEAAAPLERIPMLVRAGSVLPLAEDDHLTLHVFAPAGEATLPAARNTLFSDAGDGYGPDRVDHFQLSQTPNGFEIIRQSEGEYPFPYRAVTVQWHGVAVKKAWVDGVETPVEDNAIEAGAFSMVKIETQ